MKVALVVALTLLCVYTFVDDALANPTDTMTAKKVKEPKEIKEAATASKDLKDAMKAGKEAKKSKKDCAKECGDDYDPVCVHDPADPNFKPRSFGSECVLDVHNCEMGTIKYPDKFS